MVISTDYDVNASSKEHFFNNTFLIQVVKKCSTALIGSRKFLEVLLKVDNTFFRGFVPIRFFVGNYPYYLVWGKFTPRYDKYFTHNLPKNKPTIKCGFKGLKVRPYVCSMKIPIWVRNQMLDVSKNEEKGRNPIWREKVILRDKVCQCCGFDKHLEAHHIFSYRDNEKLRDKLENGITLCKFCHKKYHSAYGRDGANPKDLAEFMRRFSVR